MLGYDKPLYLMAFDHLAGRYRDVIDAYRGADSSAAGSSPAATDGGTR